MKNNRKFFRQKQRSYLAAGVIALAAAAAMGGLYYKNTNEKEQARYQTAQTQERETPKEQEEPETVETIAQEEQEQSKGGQEQTAKTQDTKEADQKSAPEKEKQQTQNTAEKEKTLTFDRNTKIGWPVQGNILMNYSMDKTIYFATLDQYKYNPAVIIQGAVNTKVLAAADCRITDVSANETTGLTVTADLGSGYGARYGQLKEVKWEKGDRVDKGEVIGYIAEPTKYYSVEGSNLYFAMTKDENPINPMNYLE